MIGTMDLRLVRMRQDELRREADERRLAARASEREERNGQARRVLGLRIRLSPA